MPRPSRKKSAPPGAARTQTLANDRGAIEQFLGCVVASLEGLGYPKASVFAVRLALHEAITNAFVHGHEGLPASTPITIRWSIGGDLASFTIEDQGQGFRPENVPDPTLDENLEAPSGRGLMLMRAYMTSVRYNDKGNRLELTYRRPV